MTIRQTIPKCSGDYSSSNEDQQSWFPGWKLTSDNISYSQSIQNAFIYQSGDEIDLYKYSGIVNTYADGGYIYEFRGRLEEMKSNLTKLHELSWIDSQTRAIIIQMTLYNPNVALFTSIIFLSELFSTGGVFVQSRFDPINLNNQLQGVSSIPTDIEAIIYMLFIIYFTFIELRSLIKLRKKYFYSIWSFIQWGTILCSWAGVGIYIWRFKEGSRLHELLHDTNGYKYINIEKAVYFDNTLMFLFGFCCFFGTIKYLYLSPFNSRLSQFGKTLEYVQQDLFYFASTFSIIYISFISLFYLLFNAKIPSCSDIYHTSEMLLEILLLRFDSQDLYEADTVLGPLAFALFIFIVVFICCTMVISIINNGFRDIRRNSKSSANEDQSVLLFLFVKIKQAFGLYILI
jgi:polycystin 1L2